MVTVYLWFILSKKSSSHRNENLPTLATASRKPDILKTHNRHYEHTEPQSQIYEALTMLFLAHVYSGMIPYWHVTG